MKALHALTACWKPTWCVFDAVVINKIWVTPLPVMVIMLFAIQQKRGGVNSWRL